QIPRVTPMSPQVPNSPSSWVPSGGQSGSSSHRRPSAWQTLSGPSPRQDALAQSASSRQAWPPSRSPPQRSGIGASQAAQVDPSAQARSSPAQQSAQRPPQQTPVWHSPSPAHSSPSPRLAAATQVRYGVRNDLTRVSIPHTPSPQSASSAHSEQTTAHGIATVGAQIPLSHSSPFGLACSP